MLPLIYEFVKFISNIFILAGITCLFNNLYFIAFLMFASFVIIKVVDSDWAFKKFDFKNHNAIVIYLTISLIFINMISVYKNMQNSPIFIRATEEQKKDYLNYENQLFNSIKQCSDFHNKIMDQKTNNITISEEEEKTANAACTNAISIINEISIQPKKEPATIVPLMKDLKDNFKYIALNLSNFNYADNQNAGINTLLKSNLSTSYDLIKQLRTMLGMPEQLENEKQNIVKTN